MNASIGDGEGIGTISDNDPTPTVQFASGALSAYETIGYRNVRVELSAASGKTVTVAFTTTDGTAAAGSDYSATTSTVTFAPGQTMAYAVIPITDDSLDEDDETFSLSLSDPVNATVGATGTTTVTVIDDGPVSTSIATLYATGVDSSHVKLSTSVTIDPHWQLDGGNAYLPETGSPNWLGDSASADSRWLSWNMEDEHEEPAGTIYEYSTTFSVTSPLVPASVVLYGRYVSDDDLIDIEVNGISQGISGTAVYASWNYFVLQSDFISGTNTVSFFSRDTSGTDWTGVRVEWLSSGPSDEPPEASFSSSSYSVNENETSGEVTVTVNLDAASGKTIYVPYYTSNNTAISGTGNDYTSVSSILTFTPGQTQQTFTVPILDDSLDEIDEEFYIRLTPPTNATIASNPLQATVQILDNDSPLDLSISDPTVTEVDTGTVVVTFTVSMPASGQTVTVDYQTADDSAIAGTDYVSKSGTLTFNPGDISELITITVNGDELDEINEKFLVNLSNSLNAGIADNQGEGTITDNDPTPTVQFASGTVSTYEATGTKNVKVILGAASGKTVTVDYSTTAGTATADVDYTTSTGTVTFTPGQTVAYVSIPIAIDALDESDETFTITLADPGNADLGTAVTTTITIIDDTPTPTSISNLYATGVDNSNILLDAGEEDEHYLLTDSADPVHTGDESYVVNEGYPLGLWQAQGPDSQWISIQPGNSAEGDPGYYTFHTEFTLSSTSAVLVGRWLTDDQGADILVNGVSTGISRPGYNISAWQTFVLDSTSANFNSGTNTLDFVVHNDSGSIGLRVEWLTANEAPEITVPAAQTTNEDEPLVFSVAGGNEIEIADDAIATAPLEVSLQVPNGSLTLSGTTGLTFVCGANGSGSMTFTGTLDDINTALDGLAFLPAANFHSATPVSLQIDVDDLGSTSTLGIGGPQTDSDTVDITVDPVNDAPIAVDDPDPTAIFIMDFNEGIGTTAVDSVGAKTGTLQGNAFWDADHTGSTSDASLSLDGDGDYVSVPDSADFDLGSSNFSVSAWINFSEVRSNAMILGQDPAPGMVNKWVLFYGGIGHADGHLYFHVNYTSGWTHILDYHWDDPGAVVSAPVANTWYQIVVSRRGNDFTMSVNGTVVDTGTYTDPIPAVDAPLTIGWAGEDNAYFPGLIDQVEIKKGGGTYSTPEDTALTFDLAVPAQNLLVNDIDVDGDTLSLDDVGNPSAQGGTVTRSGSIITYTPLANYTGLDSFTYTITDGDLTSTATVYVMVTPVNDAPTAVDDPEKLGLGWWTFDTSVGQDETLFSHDGTAIGDAAQDAVNVPAALGSGSSLALDGTGDYVRVPDAQSLSLGAEDFSISLWAWWASGSSSTSRVLIGHDEGTGDVNKWYLGLVGGNLVFHVNGDGIDPGGENILEYAWSAFAEEQWYNLVVTRQGDAWSLYIDNVLADMGASAVVVPDPVAPLTIGSAEGLSFSGNLDDVRIYRVALSENDIEDLYEGTAATPGDPSQTNEDTALTIAASTVKGNDSDIDGDPINVLGYVTGPSHGTLTFNGTNFVYTPNPNFHGLDSFTYLVSDTGGLTDTAIVSIAVSTVNDVPVAQDDSETTGMNTPLTLDVRVNDTDADGDTLTVSLPSTSTAQSGTVSVNTTTQLITYTPPSSTFIGVDSFSYTIDDGHSGQDTATVTVFVGDGQWATYVISDDTSSAWTYSPYDWFAWQALGTPNTFAYGDIGTAWAPDPMNGLEEEPETEEEVPDEPEPTIETISVGFDTPANATGVLVRQTYGNGFVTQIDLMEETGNPATPYNYYTIWVTGDPTIIDQDVTDAPVNFVVTFDATEYEVAGVKIHVNVDHSEDEWEEIDAIRLFTPGVSDPGNTAPVAAGDADSTNEDTPKELIDVLANDTNTDDYPLIITITDQPDNGYVEIDIKGTPLDITDDRLVYTPDPDFNGTDTFKYTITDIFGQVSTSATVTITVTAVNDDPIAADDHWSVDKNGFVTKDVRTNDGDIETTTLTVIAVNGSALTVGVAENLPSGAKVTKQSNGLLKYEPAAGQLGFDTFTYTVQDADLGTSSATVYLTVYESGYWAYAVVDASSQFNTTGDWSATQALNEPDTFAYGDVPTAWAPTPQNQTTPYETITLSFVSPAHPNGEIAYGLVIRENYGSGFVEKVEFIGAGTTILDTWTADHTPPTLDIDASGSPPGHLVDFILALPAATSAQVEAVRIYVNCDNNMGTWEEIDAVRLLTAPTTKGYNKTNTKPVAERDWTATDTSTAVTIDVRANDYDPDGDALSVSEVDGSATSGTITLSGGRGTVDIVNGAVKYTPGSATGLITIPYKIKDGLNATSNSANLYVYVEDGLWANTAEEPTSEVMGQYTGSAIDILGSPDAAPGGWSPSGTDGEQVITVGFQSEELATGVLIQETGAFGFVQKVEFLDDSKALVGTPWEGDDLTTGTGSPALVVPFAGTAQFVRITIDPSMGGCIESVRLLIDGTPSSNSAPTATGTTVTGTEDTSLPIDLFSSLATDGDTGDVLRITILRAPEHGTLTIDPGATPYDPSDDSLLYTPEPNYSNTSSNRDWFEYKVTDLYGASDSDIITVAINAYDDAPSGVVDYAVAEAGGNPVAIDVLDNDSDPEGTTLVIDSFTQPTGSGSVSTAVSVGLDYDPDTAGPDGFTYVAEDAGGKQTTVSVYVQVYEAGLWATNTGGSSSPESEGEVVGRGDTFDAFDVSSAWVPEGGNPMDYIIVGFGTSTSATGLAIREIGGSIARIQYRDTGDWQNLWEGTDPNGGELADLVVSFANATSITDLQIFIDNSAGGFNAIDAVRLITGGSTDGTQHLSTRGYDSVGRFNVTNYTADGLPALITASARGIVVQSTALEYTSGILSALTTTVPTATGNQVTRLTFDSSGNKLTETLAYGTADAATTNYGYTDGKLTSLQDPNTNLTTWGYSTPGQVVITDPNLNTTTKVYSTTGRLLSVVDRNERLRTFEYSYGKLVEEKWYDGDQDTDPVVMTKTWVYNANGQLETATSDDGTNVYTYSYKYDSQGRLIHVDEPFGVSLDFGYDQYGYRNLVIDSKGGREESIYNASGQLLRRMLKQGGTVLRLDQEFDAHGRVEKQSRYSDAAGTTLIGTTQYGYAIGGQVESIVNKDASGDLISQFDYEWDVTGQLISKTEEQPDLSATPVNFNFGYDDQGQLTDDGGGNTYDYDLSGNRDAYTTGDDNRLDDDGTWTYSHDDEGNVTKKIHNTSGIAWTYGYDHANQLTTAREWDSDPDAVGDPSLLLNEVYKYTYDDTGNRIQKQFDTNGDGTWDSALKFAIDGWNPIKPSPIGNENVDVLLDMDGSGSLISRYLRGDRVDEIIGRIEDVSSTLTPYWYLTDNLGSVRDIQSDGSTWESVSYDGFGNITSSVPSTLGRYAWTGRERDVEIDLQYNRARYYDPSTGRWMSQDPLGFDAGDSNLYRYVNNRPVQATDPSGLQPGGNLGFVHTYGKDEVLKSFATIANNKLVIKVGEGAHLKKHARINDHVFTFKEVVAGDNTTYFDLDSVQAVVLWTGPDGKKVDQVTNAQNAWKPRTVGAEWSFGKEGNLESATWPTDVPAGATHMEVVVVYTDVAFGPPHHQGAGYGDLPVIIGAWSADLRGGAWKIQKGEVETRQKSILRTDYAAEITKVQRTIFQKTQALLYPRPIAFGQAGVAGGGRVRREEQIKAVEIMIADAITNKEILGQNDTGFDIFLPDWVIGSIFNGTAPKGLTMPPPSPD